MEPNASTSRVRHSLRVLRPLIWWLLLVLVMYAIRTHLRLSEQTHLSFAPELKGQPVAYDVQAMLDNNPPVEFTSGSRIPIGWHQLTLRHPKVEPFTTNLFIWYGENDLGEIVLKRSTGSLHVAANPPAGLIEIRGPEFSMRLTNSPGITVTVPTDQYAVNAYYRHWQQRQEITVSLSSSEAASFSPRLGAVQLTCNQTGAVFEVLNARDQLFESGKFPATLQELPEGTYKLVATHHGNPVEQTLTVKAGGTNGSEVRFNYAKALLETVPPGATVYDANDRELGVTPLLLPELKVGARQFSFRLTDYDLATGTLEVTASETNRFHTNLISRFYTLAMESARRSYAGQDYEQAREAAAEALKHKPADPAAMNLERDAIGQAHLARARILAERGAYAEAIREVNVALTSLPENENGKGLLADYTVREQQRLETEKKRAEELAAQQQRQRERELAEQQAHLRQEQINQAFNLLDNGYENAPMFSRHELTATNLVNPTLGMAFTNAFLSGVSAFKLVRYEWPRPDTFTIQARQILGFGYRECLVVGGQVRPGEMRIHFKVFEYEHLPDVSLLGILNLSARVTSDSQDPRINQQRVERMRERILAGIQMARERIQTAISR